MTLPLSKAVNSLFNKCGQTGVYKGKNILFLLSEPDTVVGIGFAQTHSSTYQAKIRISDAPNLKVGDKIITSDLTYVVQSEPIKDIHNLIWSLDFVCG